MPGGRDPDDSEGAPPRLSLWHRVLLALPRLRRDEGRAPLTDRLRDAVLKPVEPGAAAKAKAADEPMTVEELRAAVKSADDKERLTGLLMAPVAAAIAIVVVNAKIATDPAALLKNGQLNPRHVAPSTFHELAVVFLILALLILVAAMLRKRMLLGIVMALYGLSLFNLPPYWGFGIPYILAGAWLLVRAYRLQRDLREATGQTPSRPGNQGRQGRGRRPPDTSRPRPNKRYTPPTPPTRSPSKRKTEDEQRAG